MILEMEMKIKKSFEREMRCHAACLTIAEGNLDWDKLLDWDSPAMIAVRDLRRRYENQQATLEDCLRFENDFRKRINEIYAAAGVPTPSTPLISHLDEMRKLLEEVLMKCWQEIHHDECGIRYRGCSPRCLKRRIEAVLGISDSE